MAVMSVIEELQLTTAGLARGIAQDTTLGLALAAVWLDPLMFSQASILDDLYGNEEDPESLMRFALNVARDCSSRLYVEMAHGLRQGWTFDQMGRAFCASLKHLYPHIPLNSLYAMSYGIPLEFCGLQQTEPEFATNHPGLAGVLERFFDVHPVLRECYRPEDETYAIEEEQFYSVCQIARPIINSLIAEDRQPYADIALMAMYLFSMTGNSLLDISDEDYWDSGFEPMMWEPEHLETANVACQQAHIVLDAVDRALMVLDTQPDIAKALLENIAAVRLERKKTHVALSWPARNQPRRVATSYLRATGADLALLFVRDCYRERNRDRQD
jgi:hypothetical protein